MHPFHSTCMSIHWIKRMISVGEQRNATTRKLRTATDNRIKGPKGRPAPMRSAAARRAARILTTARRGRSSRALTPPGPSPPPPLPRSQQRNSPPFIRFGGEAASLWRGRRIVSSARRSTVVCALRGDFWTGCFFSFSGGGGGSTRRYRTNSVCGGSRSRSLWSVIVKRSFVCDSPTSTFSLPLESHRTIGRTPPLRLIPPWHLGHTSLNSPMKGSL